MAEIAAQSAGRQDLDDGPPGKALTLLQRGWHRAWFAYGQVAGWATFQLLRHETALQFEHLGTSYGGWTCATRLLTPGGTALCIGAGEDVSFDVLLNARYGQDVVCIDPTPRAVHHVSQMLARQADRQSMAIGGGPETYAFEGFSSGRFRLLPYAVWSEDGVLDLFVPRDRGHVSHSAVNLQGTSESIPVVSRRVSTILHEIGARGVQLMKMDVEGAEYEVLRDLARCGVRPVQLLVEFEEVNWPQSAFAPWRLLQAVRDVLALGYRLVAASRSNFVFVREDALA